MNIKKSGYALLILLITYLILHTMQHYQLGFEWIRFYGKDLILVPLLLVGTQIIGNEIQKPLRVSTTHIVLIVVYVSIVFEWLIPLINPEIYPDPLDIVMYSTGGMGFYLINKKLLNKGSWKSSRSDLPSTTY